MLIVFASVLTFAITAGVFIYVIIDYNQFVRLKNNIDKAESNISVLIKQRFDELNQLIKVCKRYMNYENETLKKLIDLRTKFEKLEENVRDSEQKAADKDKSENKHSDSSQSVDEEDSVHKAGNTSENSSLNEKDASAYKKEKLNRKVTGSLGELIAVAENYPELKTSEQFLHLQSRISDIEMQIADRREFFNDTVVRLNNKIESFPDMIVAKMFSYKQKDLFEVEEEEKKIPGFDKESDKK